MPEKVLVAYATRYGSTQEVAQAVAATLKESGFSVDLRVLREVRKLDGYQAVVLGAPLFMFHWHKDALGFLGGSKPRWRKCRWRSSSWDRCTSRMTRAEWKSSWEQLEKELAPFPWLKPVALEMFGGRYDPEKLGFPLKMFAGKEPASDLRDWESVRRWAGAVGEKLQQGAEQG